MDLVHILHKQKKEIKSKLLCHGPTNSHAVGKKKINKKVLKYQHQIFRLFRDVPMNKQQSQTVFVLGMMEWKVRL